MVTICLRAGQTTLAFFQNFSSVACASGSAAIPLRISVSLMRRRRSQSVLPGGLAFDVLPVVAPFVRLRAPRRDDASFIFAPVRIDNSDFQAVDQANCVYPYLAVVGASIDRLNRRSFKVT